MELMIKFHYVETEKHLKTYYLLPLYTKDIITFILIAIAMKIILLPW